MARTTPVHSGYTIVNGVGTGSAGYRIDVWFEYKVLDQSVSGNWTEIDIYFYAALHPGYSSGTYGSNGGYSDVEEDDGGGWSIIAGTYNVSYDFRSTSIINDFFTRPEGDHYTWVVFHDDDGVARTTFKGEFETTSTYISGGYVNEFLPNIPDIPRGGWVRSGGIWRQALAYARSGGAWKQTLPYAKSGGAWKQST